MKNPLKKPVDGSKLIFDAIGKFQSIVDEIERGAAANHSKVAINQQTIDGLQAQNKSLDAATIHGMSVATKLRELIT
jgi:hypothetical protein